MADDRTDGERLTALETHMAYVQDGLQEVKAELHDFRTSNEERLKELGEVLTKLHARPDVIGWVWANRRSVGGGIMLLIALVRFFWGGLTWTDVINTFTGI